MRNILKNKKKGFTLIELLIAISIIGLLSTLAVIQLNSSKAKARDARRMSDVRNIVDILKYIVLDSPTANLENPCNVQDISTLKCTGAQPGDIETQFIKFIDPSFPDVATANGSPCTGAGDTAPCQYSIGNDNATVSDVIIQFYLERGAGDLGPGPHTVVNGVFN